jgi:hypothetical protein
VSMRLLSVEIILLGVALGSLPFLQDTYHLSESAFVFSEVSTVKSYLEAENHHVFADEAPPPSILSTLSLDV